MGFTSILNSTSKNMPVPYQRLRDYMKQIAPRKAEVKTMSGLPAFSYKYHMSVPYDYDLYKFNLAAPLGHAFDYMARLMVAKRLDSQNPHKEEALFDLVAGYALYAIPDRLKLTKGFSVLCESYEKILDKMHQFIFGEESIESLYSSMYLISIMEGIVRRSNYNSDDAYLALVENRWQLPYDLEKLFTCQLEMLCGTFENFLNTTDIVKHGSTVIFNPSMGTVMPSKLGGADADIFIDGILIDFKTTRNNGYDWKEFAQVYGYAILADISRTVDKENGGYSSLAHSNISKVAIYKARYGELEYVDVDSSSIHSHSDFIIKLFF